MRIILFIALLFICLFFNSHTWHWFIINKQKQCWNNIDFTSTEKLLQTLPVKQQIPLFMYFSDKKKEIVERYKRSENSMPFILVFENNMKAVFKPNRSLLNQASALRAYHFSQLLEFKLVSPTVMRTINGKRGIVQLFIENASDKDKEKNLKQLPSRLKNYIYFFYVLIGEINVSPSQILFDKNCNQPALIDNEKNIEAFSVIQYGDFPYIRVPDDNHSEFDLSYDEYKEFPFREAKTIKNVSSIATNELEKIFPKVSPNFLKRVFKNTTETLDEDILYYIRWKESSWVRYSISRYNYLYKDLVPTSITKNTFEKLKALNHSQLYFMPYKQFFNKGEVDQILQYVEPFDKLILYKTDRILDNLKVK